MIAELVNLSFNEWINSNLTGSIKSLKAKISENELRNFILNHERLPLLKSNLIREISNCPEVCLDKQKIRYLTEEMAKMFMATAILYHEKKRNSYGQNGKASN